MVAVKHNLERQLQRVYARMLHVRGVLQFGAACPSLFEVVSVPPDKIVGHITAIPQWFIGHGYSLVVGGNWDSELPLTDFSSHPVYISCHMRWVQGADWEETPVYQDYLRKIHQGKPSHPKAQDVESLRERYRQLDVVYRTVVAERAMSTRAEDLVRISMARDGRLFWGPDGRHRIVMAKIAGLAAIPARAGFVHPDAIEQFQALRLPRLGVPTPLEHSRQPRNAGASLDPRDAVRDRHHR